jgi:hypothetical protein
MNFNEVLPRQAFCEWTLSVKVDKKSSLKREGREKITTDNIPSK